MTEIETEVKIERNNNISRTDVSPFSSRAFSSSASDDLKRFETYKPADLNDIYNRLEKKTENKKVEQNFDDCDLDRFTKLENEEFPVVMSKTVVVDEPKVALKINLKGKLIIFVASVALVLFAFLAIFNAVTIGSLNKSIYSLNKQIAVKEVVVNQKISTYNALTDEMLLESKAEGLGFEAFDDASVHTISFSEVNSNSSTDAQKNWFDSFCDFMSQLFGA